MSGPKEQIYDEQISPLMGQIIAICKAHRINMAASFSLDFNEEEDSPLRCTTALAVDMSDEDGFKMVNEAERLFMPRPLFAAFTITRE